VPTPELNKALAAFQQKLPHIPKAATAHYGKYADLEDVSSVALPLLGEQGLAYTAEPGQDDEGRLVLDYALLHESGEERARQFPLWLFLPERATAQTAGGLITFFRRYCLCSVTGIAPGGEDDDGQAASQPADGDQRPAERTAGDNPWETKTPTYLAGIGREFKRLQIVDRDVRLGYVAKIIGRNVTTPAQLTVDEQKSLLQFLSSCPTEASLDEKSKQEVST
jgi:hypothetical protein